VNAVRLEARGLSKSFGGPALFSGLSFDAESGLVAVRGRNGSGKTTLLKILAGLARPSAGTVAIRRDGSVLTGEARRLAVGWAAPDLAFYRDLTAQENLAFFREAAGTPTAASEIARRLEGVGLGEARGKAAGELSSGMTQRLRLAFARLFEPSATLDAEGRALVARIVEESRRSSLVVLASNDEKDFDRPDLEIRLGDERE
jgi:ABC-type multidrug transport system ATPase subunit